MPLFTRPSFTTGNRWLVLDEQAGSIDDWLEALASLVKAKPGLLELSERVWRYYDTTAEFVKQLQGRDVVNTGRIQQLVKEFEQVKQTQSQTKLIRIGCALAVGKRSLAESLWSLSADDLVSMEQRAEKRSQLGISTNLFGAEAYGESAKALAITNLIPSALKSENYILEAFKACLESAEKSRAAFIETNQGEREFSEDSLMRDVEIKTDRNQELFAPQNAQPTTVTPKGLQENMLIPSGSFAAIASYGAKATSKFLAKAKNLTIINNPPLPPIVQRKPVGILSVIDIDALIARWAELWVLESHPCNQLDWYNITGKGIEEKLEGNDNLRGRNPHIKWPPRVSYEVIAEPMSEGCSEDIETEEKEVVFSYGCKSEHDDLQREPTTAKNTFKYSTTVFTNTTRITTNRVFRSALDLQCKVNVHQKMVPLSLHRGSEETQGEKTAVSQTIETPSPEEEVVLEALKSCQRLTQKLALSGYVTIAAEKLFHPGERYTSSIGDAQKTWVIPIDKVFEDLKRYQQENKLSEKLKNSLEVFTVDSEQRRVFSTFECQCETITKYELTTRLKREVWKQFEQQLELYKGTLRRYHQENHRIERLVFEDVCLEEYYAELTLLESSQYADIENKLNQLKANKAAGIAETEEIYAQMAAPLSGRSLKLESLFPPKNHDDKWHIRVTGTAGVGKTTLCKKMASEAKDWCFYIAIRNLSESNYPPRPEKPYTLAEILVRENFEGEIATRFLRLIERHSLWKGYFDAIVQGDTAAYTKMSGISDELRMNIDFPQVLIILDGYDEKNIPEQLEPVFRALISCRHVVLTSRPYNLVGLKEVYHFQPGQRVEVTGFSKETMQRYMDDFFKSIASDTQKDNRAKQLIEHLNKTPYLYGACRIPVNCEMACTAWALGTFDDTVVTMAGLYNALLESLYKRYLKKFKCFELGKSLEDTDREEITIACQYEVAFAEYAAFTSLITGELFFDTIAARKYLPESEQKHALLRQKQFGFMKPGSDQGNIKARQLFYFSHLTFRDYFAARYVAQALQIKCRKAVAPKNPVVESQARIAVMKKQAVTKYFARFYYEDDDRKISQVGTFIQERKFQSSFEYALWFITGLLAQAKDIKTIQYFYQCLLGEPEDIDGYQTTLILTRCLDESQNILVNLDEQLKSRLFSKIQGWLGHSFIESSPLNKFSDFNELNPLWERLKISRNLLQCQEMRDYFSSVIETSNLLALSGMIRFFYTIHWVDEEILERLPAGIEKLVVDGKTKVSLRQMFAELVSQCHQLSTFMQKIRVFFKVSVGMKLALLNEAFKENRWKAASSLFSEDHLHSNVGNTILSDKALEYANELIQDKELSVRCKVIKGIAQILKYPFFLSVYHMIKVCSMTDLNRKLSIEATLGYCYQQLLSLLQGMNSLYNSASELEKLSVLKVVEILLGGNDHDCFFYVNGRVAMGIFEVYTNKKINLEISEHSLFSQRKSSTIILNLLTKTHVESVLAICENFKLDQLLDYTDQLSKDKSATIRVKVIETIKHFFKGDNIFFSLQSILLKSLHALLIRQNIDEQKKRVAIKAVFISHLLTIPYKCLR